MGYSYIVLLNYTVLIYRQNSCDGDSGGPAKGGRDPGGTLTARSSQPLEPRCERARGQMSQTGAGGRDLAADVAEALLLQPNRFFLTKKIILKEKSLNLYLLSGLVFFYLSYRQ